jgi:hypothetical protein
MHKWQSFLNSLSTPGGNLLIMVLFAVALLIVLLFRASSPEGQVQTIILGAFSAFSGALLLALRGRTSDIPTPPGSTSSTATTSHSSAVTTDAPAPAIVSTEPTKH